MTDVTEDRDQAGAELSAADEQVLRELTPPEPRSPPGSLYPNQMITGGQSLTRTASGHAPPGRLGVRQVHRLAG